MLPVPCPADHLLHPLCQQIPGGLAQHQQPVNSSSLHHPAGLWVVKAANSVARQGVPAGIQDILGIGHRKVLGQPGCWSACCCHPWRPDVTHLMCRRVDVALLAHDDVGQVLVLPGRCWGWFEQEPAGQAKMSGPGAGLRHVAAALPHLPFYFLGAGLQSCASPLAPARQNQVHRLRLPSLLCLALLLAEVSDDVVPGKGLCDHPSLVDATLLWRAESVPCSQPCPDTKGQSRPTHLLLYDHR